MRPSDGAARPHVPSRRAASRGAASRGAASWGAARRLAVACGLVVAVAACSTERAPAASSTSAPVTSVPVAASTRAPATTSLGSGPGSPAGTGSDWLQYHRFPDGSGRGPSSPGLSHPKAAWTSPALDGTLYGEPLVWGSEIVVATENDTVYALSAAHGTIVWSHHLARPVPAGDLPCGNIAPTVGITSTPVIDSTRKELFVVADQLRNGGPHHVLYGLNAANGSIEMSKGVDPPASDPAAQLQRASLTLDQGRVVFGFGGNYGDCATYHGWVESVPETGGPAEFFEVDRGPGQSQGAVWMGGAAPVVDAQGHIWVATGNGSVTSASGPYDDSDAVLELSAHLGLVQHFAPSHWYGDNASDLDLGSAAPALLPSGLVVQAGKSNNAYLLRASHLGGVGGQIATLRGICGGDVAGGAAFGPSVAYLPCESGLIKVVTDSATGSMHERWKSPTGAGGPPILAGGLVWTISNGTLYGLSPDTGKATQQLAIGQAATSFPTPSVGDGLLLAPSANQVHAFRPS